MRLLYKALFLAVNHSKVYNHFHVKCFKVLYNHFLKLPYQINKIQNQKWKYIITVNCLYRYEKTPRLKGSHILTFSATLDLGNYEIGIITSKLLPLLYTIILGGVYFAHRISLEFHSGVVYTMVARKMKRAQQLFTLILTYLSRN